MRVFIYLSMLFVFLNGDERKEFWQSFDSNVVKQNFDIYNEEVNFEEALNGLLSDTLENYNAIDYTEGNLNFENQNIQIRSLKSLFESENHSLLLQNELYATQDTYDYFGGLVHRYEKDDFLLGLNGFTLKEMEQKQNLILGTEFIYDDFVKAYTNYYDIDESDENLQFGLSFATPKFQPFLFDISKETGKNNEKTNYQFSYTPYDIVALSVAYENSNEVQNTTAVYLKFNFNFNEKLKNQLKLKEKLLQGIKRYDFLQRMR